MTQPADFITPTAAAAKHGISRAQVCALARQDRIPGAFQVGRHWNIPAGWVYVRRQPGPRPRPP
jgi:hypothetical protein